MCALRITALTAVSVSPVQAHRKGLERYLFDLHQPSSSHCCYAVVIAFGKGLRTSEEKLKAGGTLHALMTSSC